MRNLLGGKGAGLSEMSSLGIPVPPGLTITTEVCSAYYAKRPPLPPTALDEQVPRRHRPRRVDSSAPVSATPRTPSSSPSAPAHRISMPGMMDTILNLGINERDRPRPRSQLMNNQRVAFDCLPPLRRHVWATSSSASTRESVFNEESFEAIHKAQAGGHCGKSPRTLTVDQPPCHRREIVAEVQGRDQAPRSAPKFPQDPWQQL